MTVQVGILAAVWAALFTQLGSMVFQAVGLWVFPLLILASGAIHFTLSAVVAFLFAERIQLDLQGDEGRAA